MDRMTLGIDVACRAAHQASLADGSGRFAWCGGGSARPWLTWSRLWQSVPDGVPLTVMMEPTCNVGPAGGVAPWPRAAVIMVPRAVRGSADYGARVHCLPEGTMAPHLVEQSAIC